MPRLGTAGQSGSSPRVRGKRRRMSALSGCPRIIPARAGQTRSRRAGSRCRPDHPRACGANCATYLASTPGVGSSPRVRGKHGSEYRPPSSPRIIPARAGQTPAERRKTVSSPDHPRACGANSLPRFITPPASGSSPRVRGKLDGAHTVGPLPRIIPARAGQTRGDLETNAHITDHPRACGANVRSGSTGWATIGSSPRVRGKHLQIRN